MISSQIRATKDEDHEGTPSEGATCMTKGHMGAAHAAALERLEFILSTHHAMPFTAQRLPGSVEGEMTTGHLTW